MFTYTEKIIATETSWACRGHCPIDDYYALTRSSDDRLPVRFLPGMGPPLLVLLSLLPLVQSGAVDETLGRAVEDAIPIIELR